MCPRDRRRTIGGAEVVGVSLGVSALVGGVLVGGALGLLGFDADGFDADGFEPGAVELGALERLGLAGLVPAARGDEGRRGSRSGGTKDGSGPDAGAVDSRADSMSNPPDSSRDAGGALSEVGSDVLSAVGSDVLARTRPGMTGGAPPRRRTTVFSPTADIVEGGITGAGGSASASAADAGREERIGAGELTRRCTASREGNDAGELDAGGRAAPRGCARRVRGRVGEGSELEGLSSIASSSTSAGLIRCSSSGAAGRSRRRARLRTRPVSCTSSEWTSSVSATAVGRRVTRKSFGVCWIIAGVPKVGRSGGSSMKSPR